MGNYVHIGIGFIIQWHLNTTYTTSLRCEAEAEIFETLDQSAELRFKLRDDRLTPNACRPVSPEAVI
jgi:hypothetical protein